MKRLVTGIALAVLALLVLPAGAQDVQQKLAAAKEAAARNQQALRSYSAVTLKVTMQAMPEGISHPGTVVFTLAKRQLEVKITKSNYQKIAQ